MADNFLKEAGAFAQDAAIDTAADGVINRVIDDVAEHVPGGEAVDVMIKTGVDLAANNAINAEVAKIEGMFGGGGHQDAAPTTDDAPVSTDDGT